MRRQIIEREESSNPFADIARRDELIDKIQLVLEYAKTLY